MLKARGLDPPTSGIVVFISYVGQMGHRPSLAPVVAAGQRDQRLIIAVVVAFTAAGLLGFIFAPVWSLSLFSVLLGLSDRAAPLGSDFSCSFCAPAIRTRLANFLRWH